MITSWPKVVADVDDRVKPIDVNETRCLTDCALVIERCNKWSAKVRMIVPGQSE